MTLPDGVCPDRIVPIGSWPDRIVGLIRNVDAGETEPPPRFDARRRDVMFGILVEHAYDGYVTVERHGPYWAALPERRKAYIRHTLRVLAPLMASG